MINIKQQMQSVLRAPILYKSNATIAATAVCLALSGCGAGFDVTFSSGVQNYSRAQRVKVEVPENATNVYLTTNNKDPVPNAKCSFKPGIINVNRPTVVKLRFDLDGETYIQSGIYIIENMVKESRYGNRVAIDIFERFIRNHVNPSFGPSPTHDATEVISDGTDGTVTRITDINGLIFVQGRQTFLFNDYKYFDPNNETYLIVKSGKIFGFRNSDGGYYNTDVDGETINFFGTFNGYANGHFYLNEQNETTGGFYRVTCSDKWCAAGEAYYALGSFREFVEIYPEPEDNPRSCD